MNVNAKNTARGIGRLIALMLCLLLTLPLFVACDETVSDGGGSYEDPTGQGGGSTENGDGEDNGGEGAESDGDSGEDNGSGGFGNGSAEIEFPLVPIE